MALWSSALTFALLLSTTHAAVQRILHFSDVHLNLTAPGSAQGGFDSPLSLLESALEHARRAVPDPAVLLYTGDHVNHGSDHTADYVRRVVEKNVGMLHEYFPMDAATGQPALVTAITGNSDHNVSYFMEVTQPESSANPSLSLLSSAWNRSLARSDIDRFSRRGYLVYDIDESLSIVSLNTVPYSVSHYPDTSEQQDPFGQFAWLNATLGQLREQSRFAFIAGHIPPIVDSNRTQSMWHEHYVSNYLAILGLYCDVVKAQFFGHVHSIEFRVPVDTAARCPLPPLFTSGAVSPKYGNNPSFLVWEYDTDTYDVVDYAVHATNVTQPRVWDNLFRASSAYDLPALSTAALSQFRSRVGTDLSLLAAYYWNLKARSFNLAPCDDAICQAKTLCSVTWWPTQKALDDCVIETRAKHGQASWLAWPLIVLGLLVLAVAYSARCGVGRTLKRQSRVVAHAPYIRLAGGGGKKKRWSVAPLHDEVYVSGRSTSYP